MLSHEVIRAAASLIRAGGHSQGCNARDAYGREVPLYTTGSGENGRASINPAAVAFSMYGAVAAVIHRNPSNPSVIWPVLDTAARKAMEGRAATGGSNYLHPLILLNEHMDTDKDAAVGFLEGVASTLETSSGVTNKVAVEVLND